jgi:hypothetical protein
MIRMPRHFNGLFVTRHFFPEFLRHDNRRGINGGYCYDWAYLAYRMFEGVQLWTTDYHAWIRIGRKWHDSETNRFGVLNFMELGCNYRNSPIPWESQPPRSMDVEEFKTFWNREGSGHRFHWDSMLEARLKRVLGKRFSQSTPIFQPHIPCTTVP